MRIRKFFLISCLALPLAYPAMAYETGMASMKEMKNEHGGGIFHMFRLETDAGSNKKGDSVQNWELDGWIGTDENKLWLKSEGERNKDELESTEFWALYSRNISMFWDAQAGIRYDTKPNSTTYLTLGFNGLAPYWLETEAHLFMSDNGDVSARLRGETDFLITQKLILQPYIEVNLFAQDVKEKHVGSGISDGQIGLQTRYEFTRKFALYMDVHYASKFGETSSIAKKDGEDSNEAIGTVGLRLMF